MIKTSQLVKYCLYSFQRKTWVPQLNNKETNIETKSTCIRDSQFKSAQSRTIIIELHVYGSIV